ncbi:MAG: ABC transporter permease, partial [Mobilitalea sp.]
MKKSNISGWKDVFTFTLKQTLKSKAFIISYVILIALAMISMPLINMISSSSKEDTSAPSPVTKVYVNNETTLPAMDFSEILKNERLSHIIIETLQEDYDAVDDRIETEENKSVILTLA